MKFTKYTTAQSPKFIPYRLRWVNKILVSIIYAIDFAKFQECSSWFLNLLKDKFKDSIELISKIDFAISINYKSKK